MHPLLALVLAFQSAPAGDTWPEFRGPGGTGHAAATAQPPTAFGESQNLKWKVPFAGKAWSSPVVAGNQVWYTTATELGTDYFAVCLDRETGREIHNLKLFSQAAPTDIRQYNTYASPTPCLSDDGQKIFAHFGTHGTACVETRSGQTLWERKNINVDHYRGPASSPILFDGRLYLIFDGFDRQFVVCLNARNGETLWEKNRDLPYRNSGNEKRDNDFKKGFATASVLTIDGKPQLVAPAAMGTIAYDPATGRELWKVITDGMNQASRPVVSHGQIYITAGHSSTLFAIRASNLSGNVTATHVAYTKPKIAPTRPSPIVVGDDLYFVNDTGILVCLDARTGKEKWKESLGEKFSSSPIFADGRLILGSEAGTVFVVKPGDSYELLFRTRLDAPIRATPAAVGRDLFIRTYTHLYRFSH
jgi:outer membrane protein assembly factor BamB